MGVDNKYTKMQKDYYESTAKEMAKMNHRHHDNNMDYWNVLLDPIKSDSKYWKGKTALEFGCGTGRNVCNLLRLAYWDRVDGVDISQNNIDIAKGILKTEGIPDDKYNLFINDGISLDCLKKNRYDFIMSTIVLQHIAMYDIRYKILEGMHKALKKDGEISIQMGFGRGYGKAEYKENAYEAKGTNTKHDVIIEDASQIVNDLSEIGFHNINFSIKKAFSDGHPKWIYLHATK